jgi:AhpD family alkylhydroperoxidase
LRVVARRNISARNYPQKFTARQRQGLHYSRICAIRCARAQKKQSVTLRENAKFETNPLSQVKMRASQINGCAYCLDMHSKDARAAGESEQRLYLLDAWREAPFYSDRERAALEWTEAVTLAREGHVPDDVYTAVREHFSEEELVKLTLAVVAINGWNRVQIAFRAQAGTYRPPRAKAAQPAAA